jgi:Bacterial PH domain
MDDIVIRDRAGARVLALIPAIAVVLSVRLLTLGTPPTWLRLTAAGGVAVAAWVAYRLLTARLVVGEEGLHVRGVLYEADVDWAELDEISRTPSGLPLRLLVWGIFSPETLTLRASGRRLRPVAAITTSDDDELRQAMHTMQARLRGWPGHGRPVEDNAGIS